jgi:Transcriptional regulators
MYTEEAAELHFLLFNFMGLFHNKFLHEFRKKASGELKKNHVKIISMLYQQPYLTSTEIARMLDIEKGSVTTLIDQLTEAGLVVRCDTPNDRRKTLVKLTEPGRSKMEQIRASDIETINEILQDVDGNDLQQFLECLRYSMRFMNRL